MRNWPFPRQLLPSHTAHPVRTLARVLRSRDASARAAVLRTALSAAATPLDVVLSVAERAIYRRSIEPKLPTVFVCGPARSGTSVTAQTIIRQFDVAYLPNVVEIFPRGPVLASRLLLRRSDRGRLEFSSFYGKSRRAFEPSDAMAIWDRWLGSDRDSVPLCLAAERRDSMRRFFAAWESTWNQPVVAKYNRLYICAEAVAAALPRAHFVCLQRNPVFLAQAQLIARRLIVGDENRPYGPITPEYQQLRRAGSPVQDACAYVAADYRIAARTRSRISPQRFWTVSYERFCRDPNVLLERLSKEVLGIPYRPLSAAEQRAIDVSSKPKVDEETFAALRRSCEEFGLTGDQAEYFT
jgi:hypothetical protein